MKIVLYSGGQSRSNHRLHQAVVRLARQNKRNGTLQLTYIPFCADYADTFYKRAIRRYRAHGIERFFLLPVDNSPSKDEIEVALSSDIIYLAGGNTFYFLKHLRRTGMLAHLKQFAERGGVLAGLSAGGLVMSPNIKLAADRDLGPDENEVGLKNLNGIGLFPFEFSPHFEDTKKQIQAHLNYSKKTRHPIFAASDGGGIIIEGNTYTPSGLGCFFFQGHLLKFG